MSWIMRRKQSRDSPTLWGGGGPLESLHREMDQLFETFLGRMEQPLAMWPEGGFPSLDVSETDEAVHVTADVPGMGAEDIKVTLEGDRLVIAGEKSEEHEESARHWVRRERSNGSFRREIAMPSGVDCEHVNATFDRGVLHIEIPRVVDAASRPRPIEVKDSGKS